MTAPVVIIDFDDESADWVKQQRPGVVPDVELRPAPRPVPMTVDELQAAASPRRRRDDSA